MAWQGRFAHVCIMRRFAGKRGVQQRGTRSEKLPTDTPSLKRPEVVVVVVLVVIVIVVGGR